MTPLRLSHTWHRRLYVAIFLLSLSLVAIFVIEQMGIFTISDKLRVNLFSALIAAVTLIGSAVLFFLEEKLSGFMYSASLFTLLAIALGWQVVVSGGVASPYLLLWALISFFAALFGAYVWIAILFLVGSYIAGLYLAGKFNLEALITLGIGSILPLIAGIFIWREQGELDDSTKNVRNLANQLSEVASRSEIVINAIGDGVMAIDTKGTIQLINPAAQEMLGWGKQDALMLSYKSVLKLEDETGNELSANLDPIDQVLNTNQQSRAKHLISVTKSGKKISVSLVVSPIGTAGSGVIAVFRDITNDRAEEREQAEFISTASHEMRTPVASIEGYLGLAMNPNTATVDARAQDYIMKAHEAAQHLGRLFQDLLDVSKTEDGRLTNSPKVVDIVVLTETIVQGLTKKANDKGLSLIFNSATIESASSSQKKIMPVYYVNQDNDHIREILDNLIDNAIKYTIAGQVVVDITGDEDKVTVSIKDSGLGIPTEDIPHLFQKFYRVNNMDRQEIGGTGLGLYLVRRLTENMQGRIWVESVYQKGSTFFFQLPRISTQEAEHLMEEQAKARAAQLAQLASQPAAVEPVAPVAVPLSNGVALQQPLPASAVPAPVANQGPAPAITTAPAARPATTVPRGETLTREQINERVKQLEALAQQQRGSTGR
jgi:PAS domain S-box-containing protein